MDEDWDVQKISMICYKYFCINKYVVRISQQKVRNCFFLVSIFRFSLLYKSASVNWNTGITRLHDIDVTKRVFKQLEDTIISLAWLILSHGFPDGHRTGSTDDNKHTFSLSQ